MVLLQIFKLMEQSATLWIQIHHKNKLFGIIIGAICVEAPLIGQGLTGLIEYATLGCILTK